jgi:3'-5' exoribonuclease
MLIREFTSGLELDQVLLVREVEGQPKRDGGDALRLTLADRTGQVHAIVWDGVAEVAAIARPGAPVRVIGRFTIHATHGPQISLRALRVPRPGTYAIEDLLDGPQRDAGQLEADLRDLVATIQDRHLRRLLAELFDERSDVWAAYRVAPAAKRYHQAYRHGLLEHCLTVAQAVSSISATFAGIDRDVAVAGALLHDIGKIDAYATAGLVISMSDDGRLHGEIALGYYRVRRAIEALDGFPAELAQALLHIILSHHGTLEHGSPVVPCTREATLVHMVDNLGGRLGSFDRIEKQLAGDQRWSGFDRALGGGAFFPARPAPEREAEREAA